MVADPFQELAFNRHVAFHRGGELRTAERVETKPLETHTLWMRWRAVGIQSTGQVEVLLNNK